MKKEEKDKLVIYLRLSTVPQWGEKGQVKYSEFSAMRWALQGLAHALRSDTDTRDWVISLETALVDKYETAVDNFHLNGDADGLKEIRWSVCCIPVLGGDCTDFRLLRWALQLAVSEPCDAALRQCLTEILNRMNDTFHDYIIGLLFFSHSPAKTTNTEQ